MKAIEIEVRRTIEKTITPKAVLDVRLADSSHRLYLARYNDAGGEHGDLEAQGVELGEWLAPWLSEHAKTGLLRALHAMRQP